MGLFGKHRQTTDRVLELLRLLPDGPMRDVVRLLDDMETGTPEQGQAARVALVGMGDEALTPLVDFCSDAGLLSAVDALLAMGADKALPITVRRVTRGGIWETHLLARLAMSGVPGALEALREAARQGEGLAPDPLRLDSEECVRRTARLWLEGRFAEHDHGGPGWDDDGAVRSRMWRRQHLPVAAWERCPACSAPLPSERPLRRAVQCEDCGLVFAEPTYEPLVSRQRRSWAQLTGLRAWKPLTERDMPFWGETKAWVVAPSHASGPFPSDAVIAYDLLQGERVRDGAEEARTRASVQCA